MLPGDTLFNSNNFLAPPLVCKKFTNLPGGYSNNVIFPLVGTNDLLKAPTNQTNSYWERYDPSSNTIKWQVSGNDFGGSTNFSFVYGAYYYAHNEGTEGRLYCMVYTNSQTNIYSFGYIDIATGVKTLIAQDVTHSGDGFNAGNSLNYMRRENVTTGDFVLYFFNTNRKVTIGETTGTVTEGTVLTDSTVEGYVSPSETFSAMAFTTRADDGTNWQALSPVGKPWLFKLSRYGSDVPAVLQINTYANGFNTRPGWWGPWFIVHLPVVAQSLSGIRSSIVYIDSEQEFLDYVEAEVGIT